METSTILQNALRRSTGDYPSEWHCSCLFDHPEKNKTLTRQSLKARLTKKIKGNIYLSPQEMEELSKLLAD